MGRKRKSTDYPTSPSAEPEKRKRGRRPKVQERTCPHTDLAHYALGKCHSCYVAGRRLDPGKMTNCPHIDRAHYARGMCHACYLEHRKVQREQCTPTRRFRRENVVCEHFILTGVQNRPHYATGKCRQCYVVDYKAANAPMHAGKSSPQPAIVRVPLRTPGGAAFKHLAHNDTPHKFDIRKVPEAPDPSPCIDEEPFDQRFEVLNPVAP